MNFEEFINSHIKSVPELRALMLLQARPQTDWDAVEMARKLFLPPPMAAAVLTGLVSKGFLVSAGDPPRYCYQPQSAELADCVVQLAQMDRVWPVTLINLITPVARTSSQVPPLSSSQIEEGP